MGFDAGQQWESAIFQLHDHAFEGVLRFFVRNFQQLQDDRLVLAEHFARCNAEQEGVTDLTSCAGDGDTDGFFAHDRNSRTWLLKQVDGIHAHGLDAVEQP